MRLLKKAACVVLACVFCAAPVHAQTTYKATELNVPQGITAEEGIQTFSVRGDQMDLITVKQKANRMNTYRHFHSGDSGKSWTEKDAAWLTQLQKDSYQELVTGVRDDGVVYALKQNSGSIEGPAYPTFYAEAELVTYRDGQMKTLATLNDKEVSYYQTTSHFTLPSTDDIALIGWGIRDPVTKNYGPSKLFTLDPSTGAQKTVCQFGPLHDVPQPLEYSDGRFFCYNATDLNKIDFLDTAGKVVGTAAAPPEDDAWFFDATGSRDGAFYFMNTFGVFRIRPGEPSWTKILDESACKLGTAGSNYTECRGIQVQSDGSVVILLVHDKEDGRGDEIRVARTITRYTPQVGE